MVDRTTLRELGDFVAQRVDDDVRRADASGDERALSHALASKELVTRMQRDVDERPYARTEIGNFLLRAAQLRQDHPDYRAWWG